MITDTEPLTEGLAAAYAYCPVTPYKLSCPCMLACFANTDIICVTSKSFSASHVETCLKPEIWRDIFVNIGSFVIVFSAMSL